MIQHFNVRKEVFEDTAHEKLHFEISLDDKEYQGYYKDGEIDWFQMQPDQKNHEMELKDLEAEVCERLIRWESAQ